MLFIEKKFEKFKNQKIEKEKKPYVIHKLTKEYIVYSFY